MRFSFFRILSTLFIFAILISSWGCATWSSAQNLFKENEYKKIVEKRQQKASAIAELEKPEKIPEMTAEEYEKRGDYYFRQGDIDMAFLQYIKALRLVTEKRLLKNVSSVALVLESGKVGLQYKIGSIFLHKGFYEEARKVFVDILNDNPNNAITYEGLGMVFLKRGELRKAEENLRRAISLNSKLWHAHNFLGIIYDKQRKFEDAVTEYKAAIALKPNLGILFNNLGISYYLNGEYTKAVNAFDEALQKGALSKKTNNNLALALSKLGRYEEATDAFQKAGDSAKAYNNIGYVYLMEGHYEEAIEAFEKAIEINPRYYTRAHENLKRTKEEAGISSQ